MLRGAKLLLLKASHAFHLSSLLFSSRWRNSRLLILCYHGVSIDDEHEWDPVLYVPQEYFRARLKYLRDQKCSVLPLGEAVERLYNGTLPPRSVVLTFDDGFYDFYAVAWPVLQEFSMPATVYQTTYYSDYARPVFDVICSYVLWKSSKAELEWPAVIGPNIALPGDRVRAIDAIRGYCVREKLTGREKDGVILELASRLGVDMDGILNRRILQLMNPAEIREIATAGIDVQLHTHRHHAPADSAVLWAEIDQNRERIERLTGRKASHFCYPNGAVRDGVPDLLRQRGVISGTTLRRGLASPSSDPLLLERVLDTCTLADDEFLGWLTGIASFLPRRTVPPSAGEFYRDK